MAVVVTVNWVERRRANPPQWAGGRVNWIGENGREGSRGHELLSY